MVDRIRTEEIAANGGGRSQTQSEHAEVRRIQERASTDIVARLRVLLSELDDHAYIGENGYQRIRNNIVLNVRKLDEIMSRGGGMPAQWLVKVDLDLPC